jgi:hypothetical protein
MIQYQNHQCCDRVHRYLQHCRQLSCMINGISNGFIRSDNSINSHSCNSQTITTIDAYSLNWRVLDMQIGDSGGNQIVSIEELGLRHATVASLSIPVGSTIAIEVRAGCANDIDTCSLDLK